MIEFPDYKVKYLKDLTSNLLIKKLEKFNLTTLKDIINLETEDFRKLPYVGGNVQKQYDDFRNLVINNPHQITNSYNKNFPKSLPINFKEHDDFILVFEAIVNDYLNLIDTRSSTSEGSTVRNKRNVDVIRKAFGLNSKKYTYEKIGRRHRLTRERVRQIAAEKFIKELKCIINGEYIKKWDCICLTEAVEILQSFKNDLIGSPFLSEYKIKDWLNEYGISIETKEKKNYFILLLKTWGYESVSVAKHFSLKNNSFFTDESIDKELFLDIASEILSFLKKNVIPASFDDIVIEVLEKHDVSDDIIKLICEAVFEIEKSENGYYQSRFENLSSINDIVYRLLFEKQKRLSYNELLHLINIRLVHFNKEVSLDTLKHGLKKDNFIVPIGKTGVWTLAKLNTNIDSQINLILKTLRTTDIPMTVSEITHYINEKFQRKDVSGRSISSNLRNYKQHFLKIKGNKFVLAETIDQYRDVIVKTKEPIKKKGVLKTDEIAFAAKEVLESIENNTLPLRELVLKLRQINSNYTNSFIYKAISENPLIFKKENISHNKKLISLISKHKQSQNEDNSKYKWNELKKILTRELEPIFNSNSQSTYGKNLGSNLDNFFKLITFDISSECKELGDIAERILPTLLKLYLGSIDRNDKLNYLKQILTSQEAYFKKLLYFINQDEYKDIKLNKKGLGNVIEKLDKIDSRKNRYKDIRTASQFEFGKHCSRAYKNRNIDTHNAHIWTEAEIIETKTSCIVFMVYGACEYYEEIEKI